MCVYSMVGDWFNETIPKRPYYPGIEPMLPYVPTPLAPNPIVPYPPTTGGAMFPFSPISREEFDQIKRDVTDIKELLKRAKAYDEANGEPDCEIDEKMILLKKIAALVGVDLDDVLKRKGQDNV